MFSPTWYLYVDESVNNYVDCILEAEFARQVLSSSRRLSHLPGDKERKYSGDRLSVINVNHKTVCTWL